MNKKFLVLTTENGGKVTWLATYDDMAEAIGYAWSVPVVEDETVFVIPAIFFKHRQ